ncbi:hypothetical protein L211DRAFT_849685 [Terfezia boudieri ATCC MYA-4762]|uniref:Acyl-CoA dehydrogenase/oxidase N-terminal domain-containing protein n=1 Tax=Terfezia boudieri ATCC MYA-4762 TaxID=1051890 RepID=A0A3N4LQ53_9PEZI|nr:hypothetical protein L211DRAFT_849685 [Terfezia boudieri ATCC MYA-4762]
MVVHRGADIRMSCDQEAGIKNDFCPAACDIWERNGNDTNDGTSDTSPIRSLSPPISTPSPPNSPLTSSTPPANAIFHLTETEQILQETVSRFAQLNMLPKVREMDGRDEGCVIEGLLENGFMVIEDFRGIWRRGDGGDCGD